MLINASHPEENRVAIVVDGILSELDIEIAGHLQTKGNIYKAVVSRVEPGLQAAFVDYGAAKHGFLQIGEIHPNLYPHKEKNDKSYPRINEILRRGQEILVQVVKGERGNKGAALTTLLSLPGRYMVLMPDSSTKGVSRKIQDDKERKTLKKTMAQLDLPEEMGYIVRTAGIGKEEAELKRDFNYLVSLYKGILARKEKVKAPIQLYQESDIVIRSIRDYFTTEMDEVLIDNSEVYRQARDFFSLVMPDQLHLVKQHREKRPIFSRYQIEEQIEGLAHNQVPLPSGGSIVIDQTEALVAIDVNSGKMAGEKGIEATAARSNIEAAAEIGRQLRLRDLGGLIVIDFIDMRDRKKVREVEQTLNQSVKDDKARISTAHISQFGLLELSRQRIRPTLSVGAYIECPHCTGVGRVKSPDAQAVALLRQLHAAVSKGQIGTINATVPLDVANYLHNNSRQALIDLENRFDLKIQIFGSINALPEQVELELLKREKSQREDSEQTPVSHAEGLEQALAAENEPEAPALIETQTSSEEDTTTEVAPAEGTPAKRRRRRRRKRRTSTGENTPSIDQQRQQTPTTGEESAAEPPVIAEVSATSEQTPQQTTKPQGIAENITDLEAEKPKRRSRRPAAPKIHEMESSQTPEVTVTDEEHPKRRARKPAVNKGAEVTTSPTPEVAVAEVEQPKRRTRKPAAKKAEEVATSPSPEVAVAEVEKPKSRGRKPAAKKAEEMAASPTPEVAVADEEKPKRRGRKPAAKKAAEVATSPAPEVAVADEEQPKHRGRKPATKKAAEVATSPTLEVAGAEVEKPKRRGRKPAAQKVAAAATPAPAETTPPTAEKPKRQPRKPPVKKAEG